MLEKRTILQNLFIKRIDDILAINLFNYRRESLTFSQYDLLCSIDTKMRNNEKLSTTEQQLLDKLKDDCQILDEKLIEELDQQIYSRIPNRFQNLKITQAIINLTYSCNFNCVYCYQNKYKELRGTYMTQSHIDAIYELITQINKPSGIKIDELIISGGESLLPNNIEIIQYIVKRFPNTKLTLFTNGVNILKYWDVVQNFNKVQVSLDGDDKLISIVNKYPQPVFEQIIQGIKKCLENKMEVSIVMMMTKYSKNNCGDFLESIKESGIMDNENLNIRFSTASDFSSKSILPENIYSKEEYIETIQYIKSLIKGTKIGLDRIYDLKTLIDVVDRGLNKRYYNRISSCNVDKGLPVVFSPDGYIYWCSCINPPKSAIGKFFPNVEFYNEKLENLVNRNVFKFEECRKCDFRYICLSGCPLYAMEDVTNTYPKNCGIFKDEFFMAHLEEII